MTLNQQAEMFYIKKCHNCNLVEKVIHHILDKHRIHNNKEWFQISDELAIYIIDMVCNMMDNFIDYSDELIKTSINDDLDKAVKYLQEFNNINVIQDIEIKDNTKKIIIPEIKYQDNNENFGKFINEMCDINKDYECTTFDITGAYRIWANGPSQINRKKFTEFIKINYKTKRKFDNELDGQLTYYIGIKPKDYNLLQENLLNLPKYEEFILNECIFGYNYKSNINNVIDEYKNWVTKKYNHYVFDKQEQNQLYCYIDRHFFRARIKINNSKNDYQGVWGLRLKSDKSPYISIMKSNRKKILKIDIETKNILCKYSSLTAACNGFPSDYKSNCFRLSGEIKMGKIFHINDEKFILKYNDDIEE